ncbi:VOC family protein [Actinoplanes sp. L3-i22]|uniref:VOC family protein n=1 Tax=Actinoplanes sp. L3-i22 TaxID=2836373 RepID=UPI001C74A159|nr:VOC family protein [Actinoplanes sp. L3-i22]BCY10444.1 glyoxalase [Actinoplanes sp. L3-i22]
MTSIVRNVAFDCADPYVLAVFWSEVLGHPVDPDCAPGDDEVVIVVPDGANFYFQRVPEPKRVKNRVHVCLQSPDLGRDAEIERLIAAGATLSDDHRSPGGTGWAVLLDPAGNEFCLTDVPGG